MKVAVEGFDGPLAGAVRNVLRTRGHEASPDADRLIYVPGERDELTRLLDAREWRRVVLRSSAFVYGANAKNPGYLTEDRGPILDARAPERRLLELEELALARGGACLRMATVLAPGEGDRIARQLAGRLATPPFGRDPQVQFVSLRDAAEALVAAVERDEPGVFNIAGAGSLPLEQAYRAAGVRSLPAPPPPWEMLARRGPQAQLEFNTTVSTEKAGRRLGFEARESTVEALRRFVRETKGREPRELRESYDDWGLDLDYIDAWTPWFRFLERVYWRVEIEGAEKIPETGRGLFVSNHRGFMPLDAVIHLHLIRRLRRRVIRFLIIPVLLRTPWLSNFLTKYGGVVASQENAARLLEAENLVGILPEGIRGAFTPYREAYQLRDFDRSAFAAIAVRHQAPIVPAAVVGHAEMFPILGRIDSKWVRRELGWPYLPIAPLFPLAPVPLPSKWHIRILEPIPVDGFRPEDADDLRRMRELSREVQGVLQRHINDLAARRKHVFFGKILGGRGPGRSG